MRWILSPMKRSKEWRARYIGSSWLRRCGLLLLLSFTVCPTQEQGQDSLAPNSPSLSETISWLRQKIDYAGHKVDYSSGIRSTKGLVAYSDLQANGCLITLVGHSNETYYYEDDPHTDSERDWSIELPLYYVKRVFASKKDVILSFDGAKAIWRMSGWKRDNLWLDFAQGYMEKKDISENKAYTDWKIDFDRDDSQDNIELAQRASNAFQHAVELCANSQPTNNEPF